MRLLHFGGQQATVVELAEGEAWSLRARNAQAWVAVSEPPARAVGDVIGQRIGLDAWNLAAESGWLNGEVGKVESVVGDWDR